MKNQNIGAYRINGEYVTICDAQDYAESIGGRPEHFIYYGDHTDFNQWAHIGFGGEHRDSDTLDKSNHAVIVESLEKLCPNGYIVESSTHWAVGWVAGIRIDTSNLYAVAVALYWRRKLEDYPIADEDHYSAMEYEQMCEDWEDCYKPEFLRQFEDDDELIFYLNLDEAGDEDGFRDERVAEHVRVVFEECWTDSGGDISDKYLDDALRTSLEFYMEDENRRREERRLARVAEYHKYQTQLEV